MIVLIPAYEPTEVLVKLVENLKTQTEYRIVIVDDGSGEAYLNLFKTVEGMGCHVLRHFNNMGKGVALKTGFDYIFNSFSNESVICADSDGQHTVEDIVNIGKVLTSSLSCIALGTRCFEGEIPIKSKVGNKISTFVFEMITGSKVLDTQTGLRGYPYSMLKWLCAIEGERFEYELNILLEAQQLQIEIVQIPIKTIYENNNKGTHFRAVMDSISMVMPVVKFIASSLTAFILDFIVLIGMQYLTKNLFFSVIIARIISATFNYIVNRNIVFKARELSFLKATLAYFRLAIVMMMLNYFMIYILINGVGINIVNAKMITETGLFSISYLIQKIFIFKKVNTKRVAKILK